MTALLRGRRAHEGARGRRGLGLPDGGAARDGGRGLRDRAHRRARGARARACSPGSATTNVSVVIGDGTRGWPEQAPFDGILVAAAAGGAAAAAGAARRRRPPRDPPRPRPPRPDAHRLRARRDAFDERDDTLCRFVPLVRDGSPTSAAQAALSGSGADAGRRLVAVGRRGRPRRRTSRRGAGMKSVDVTVNGVVQGVYYRPARAARAALRGLRGWVTQRVRRLASRLRLQGPPGRVDAMLDWCRVGRRRRASSGSTSRTPRRRDAARLRGEVDADSATRRRPVRAGDAGGGAPRPRGAGVRRARPTRTSRCSATPSTATRHGGLVAASPRTSCCVSATRSATAELAAIAGYLHDIGNVITRLDHGIARRSSPAHPGAPRHAGRGVRRGHGRHRQPRGGVRRAGQRHRRGADPGRQVRRAQEPRARLDPDTVDIHDRVNMATSGRSWPSTPRRGRSRSSSRSTPPIIQVMEYFEIFLSRMVMCRRAASSSAAASTSSSTAPDCSRALTAARGACGCAAPDVSGGAGRERPEVDVGKSKKGRLPVRRCSPAS